MNRILTCAVICGFVLVPCTAPAAIIINEIAYDDTGAGGTDDHEFIELYNTGPGPEDISGWTLGGRDNAGMNTSAVIPGAVGSNTTVLAAGDYYVIGNAAVASRDQTVAANFLENDAEQIELWNGAINTSTLIDGLVTEANKGAGAAATQYGTPSAAMLAQMGTGYFGNFQSGHVNGQTAQAGAGSNGLVLVSQSRYIDGLDTNSNGRDFGQRRATPGAANSSGLVTQYKGPNVDSLAVGTEAPGHFGSFVNPRVVDPTTVSQFNPTSIPASPQGGNAITVWDTEFGGAGGGVDGVMQFNGRYDLFVWVDPRVTAAGDSEEWVVGIGGAADPLHNFVGTSGSVNGSSGLGWAFRRDAATRTLQLIDFGPGGGPGSRVVLGTINLTDADLGWHLLSIAINGTNVLGRYDATSFAGTTATLTGNIAYFSYREGITNNANIRPLTIDAIPEPSTLVLAGLVGLALAARWRR
jgi:hypothetical protein